MKKRLILFLLLVSNPSLFTQSFWTQVNPGFGHSYRSVHFTDALNGLACGTGGSIAKTTNGGLNWINVISGVSNHLFDIKFLTSSIAIATGDRQIILRSSNAGNNWYVVNAGTTQGYTVVTEIFAFPSGEAISYFYDYVSSDYKYLYKTTDYGATWQNSQISCYCKYVYFLNMNTGWANGAYGSGTNFHITAEKTVNGGGSWNVLYSFQTVSVNPDVIYFINENTGFRFLQLASFLYKTYNSGSSWGGVMYTSLVDINSICFADDNTGWWAGSQGAIYKSSNAGVNWVQQTSPVTTTLYKVFFINTNTGWIAAGSSGILFTNSGGVNGIKQISGTIPHDFSLFQNYPNPFNPVTNIKFDIPKSSFVKLVVYDLLGREIAALVNEQLTAGTYEADWDASGYSSGIYFCKLISGEYIQTMKMVLIK